MDRYDFIETRENVLENIKTLYSYLEDTTDANTYKWATGILKNGRIYVAEIIDSKLYFAPSRFIGYKSNTVQKHQSNHGDGNQTNDKLVEFYKKVQDERLDAAFQNVLNQYDLSSGNKKYWIPNDLTVEDLIAYSNMSSRKYWVFAPGEKCDHWDECVEKGLMLVGWDDIEDLTQYSDKKAIDKALKEVYPKRDSEGNILKDDSYRKNDVCTLWYMCHEIQEGDVVYARNGLSEIIGRGIVVSGYQYDENREDFCNVRKIKWTHLGSWPATSLSIPTIIPKYGEWVEDMERLITLSESEKAMFDEISKCTTLLQSKKNIILQGAPGTGKTYNTAAIALSVLGVTDVDVTDHKAVMKSYEELRNNGQIAFCTFHQSMEYEDFVEGLKPFPVRNSEGNVVGMEYRVEDGIFKQICNAAMDNLVQCKDSESEQGNYEELFDSYCNHIEQELARLANDGKDAAIELHPKSKMKIRGISRTASGKITSIFIGQKDNASSQSLSKKIFVRDYADFLAGEIKSYTDIKPTYESQSTFHGNAIYYFPLYQEIKKFSDSASGRFIKTKEVEKKNYVLIIDEINRGNVSKIFGELITLLESDKRVGEDTIHPIYAKLPYSKNFSDDNIGDFGVPENLYIIGTMNTTDRSTGTLDYALRRRFAFFTLKSDVRFINKYYDELGDDELKEVAVALFNDIYAFIKNPKHLCGDLGIDDLMVGHSYFMAKSKDELLNKIEFEVIPLLAEYINDGIFNVKTDERDKAFSAWLALESIEIDTTEDEEEND